MIDPSRSMMPGWQMASPPPPSGSYRINGKPVSYDEYLAAWKENEQKSNPENRPLVADPETKEWRLATDAEIQQAHDYGYNTGTAIDQQPFKGDPDYTGSASESLGSLYDSTGKQIVANTAARTQQQLDTYNAGSRAALGGLQSANDKATQDTNAAISGLEQSGASAKDKINALLDGLSGQLKDTNAKSDASLGQLTGDYSKFQDERDAATKSYLDSLAPLQQQLKAQGYTGVSTSADDINRLLDSYTQLKDNAANGTKQLQDVYGRYNELSDPTMTTKERAILDAANRSWSMADKSARDADARDLMARGVYSGGAAVAQQAARGQQLGNERVAATIQAQGSAVDRALQALAGMRGTAGDIASAQNTATSNLMSGANQIRSGNDAMSQFNATQQGITQRFQDQYAQDEQKRLQGLAQAKQDTALTKTSGDFNASSQLNSAQQDAADRAFGRSAQTTNTSLTGTANAYAIDQGIAGNKVTAADNEAGRASNLATNQLTDTTNKTSLIGSTGKDQDDALKYLLGIRAEKANLQKNGVYI